MSGVSVAVVGVTGAAGQTTLRILEERKFPVRDLRVFASERSVGKTVGFAGETVRVEKVTPEVFRGVDVAFFSAGSAQSREYAPLAVRAGAVVVDKSNAFRMDPAWVAARKASEEKAGGPLTEKDGVVSEFLKPTDYSPMK